MDVLAKNAVIVQPGNALHGKKRDLLIRNGIIEKIGTEIPEPKGITVISHPSLHVSMGWMDASVSFGEPGYEERETLENGLNTAAKSGFTRIALHPDTFPVTDHRAAVQYLINSAEGKPVSLHPIGALTRGMEGKEMAELYDMYQTGAVAFGDYLTGTENAGLMKICLQYARSFNGLIMSFPQDKSLSGNAHAHESAFTVQLGLKGNPTLAEYLRISRDMEILAYTGGKIHIPSISTKQSVQVIKKAKKRGLDVSCSATVHHLYLTDNTLKHFDTRYKVSPPLRTRKDTQALIKAVQDGTVDMLVSDHRPMDIEQKKKEFALARSGTIGLESFFGALGYLMPVENFIDAITVNPRKRFGIPLPEIKEGAVAELSFFDTKTKWTFEAKDILSSSKNSAFLQQKMKGRALGIYHNNQLVINE